jgi:hypothetical protein
VHAKGEGLGAGVGDAGEVPPPPDEPHAASRIAIATIAPNLIRNSVMANRMWQ